MLVIGFLKRVILIKELSQQANINISNQTPKKQTSEPNMKMLGFCYTKTKKHSQGRYDTERAERGIKWQKKTPIITIT
jgi:hypothetical protein